MCIRFLKRKNEEVQTGIKQFANITDMNNSINNKEGDLAVVYSSTFNDLVVGETYDTLYCPKTITLDTAITSTTYIWFSSGTSTRTATHWVRLTASAIRFYTRNNFAGASMSTVVYSSSDGITYTRTDTLAEVLTVAEIFKNKYSTITVQTGNYDILQQMFGIKSNYFGGLYKYSDSSWSLAPTQLTITSDYVYEKEFYGKNGIEIGTLQNKENLTKDGVKRRVNMWSSYKSGIVCPSDSSDMFGGCTNLTAIPLLDTSNVTNMSSMFLRMYKFNRNTTIRYK